MFSSVFFTFLTSFCSLMTEFPLYPNENFVNKKKIKTIFLKRNKKILYLCNINLHKFKRKKIKRYEQN